MSALAAAAPLAALAGGAILVLLADAFRPRRSKALLAALSLLVLAASAALAARQWGRGGSAFGGLLRLDDAALFTGGLILGAAAAAVCFGWKWSHRLDAAFGEFYGLLLLASAGLLIMVQTRDLLIVFLGLEVFSVSAYGMTGLKRGDDDASEAAVKYFLTGSFAAAFMVFGLAVLFGRSGSFDISAAASRLGPDPAAWLGVGLFILGLAYKLALVPFHMWAPDVIQGAPTPTAGFLAVAPKAAAFLVLLRLAAAAPREAGTAGPGLLFLCGVAAASLVIGNLAGLRQLSLKRLLAYSGIAHAGTMLIAVLAGDGPSLLFYMAAYTIMGLGAFASLTAMSRSGREFVRLDDLAGAGFRHPWIGAALTIQLLSLAGFPPASGFLAKWLVFSAGVQAGLTPIVVLAVILSLVAVAYYLKVVVALYMRDPAPDVEIEAVHPAVMLVLLLTAAGTLLLGIFPSALLGLIRQAAASLF
jgi:NADH-quinone oxidoreductase subunit N